MSQPFPDLVQLFDSLAIPTAIVGQGRFCAQTVAGYSACAVGKDASGQPALLIQSDSIASGSAAPVVLEHLCVIHLINCRIQFAQQDEQQGVMSVIRCTSTDRAMHEYFLRCLHPVVASLRQRPTCSQITEAVEKLIDLFRRMADPPRKAVAGMWGELFVIARSSDPTYLISSWHAIPEETYDFAFGADRLEVKVALGRIRSHHFAMEQLRPNSNIRVLIASLLTQRSEGGTSVNDLVDTIRERTTDSTCLLRLDAIIAGTLGHDWRAAQQARFDLQFAIQSLRFVNAACIPSVAAPTPNEVSAVHFRVDLSQHPLPIPDAAIQESRMFRSVITQDSSMHMTAQDDIAGIHAGAVIR